MRITNVRRGRIIRMASACGILLVLLYALHKWSTDNVASESDVGILSDSQAAYFKSHHDVYPTLKTGKKNYWLKMLFFGANKCLRISTVMWPVGPAYWFHRVQCFLRQYVLCALYVSMFRCILSCVVNYWTIIFAFAFYCNWFFYCIRKLHCSKYLFYFFSQLIYLI